MGKREVATLASKILGAYLVVQGLVVIPDLLVLPLYSNILTGGNIRVSPSLLVLGSLAPDAVWLIAGVLLWVRSGKFASAIFPTESDDVPGNQSAIQHWLTTAFVVIGFYLLVQGIPGLIGAVVYYYGYGVSYGREAGGLLGPAGGTWLGGGGSFIHHLTSAVLGCALVLFANKMISFLYPADIRSADVEE
jgi:hypothetical protein